MSKLKKFEIFRTFFKDVVGFIFATFFIIFINVHFVYGERYAEDALMRFAALLGLGMYALMAFALIEELKDDWKKLKYVLKTLKNDGDNDDTCECEEHDDTYKDDTYKDDTYEYDDEYDDEELKQKNIKERVWEIFANVLLKIPT